MASARATAGEGDLLEDVLERALGAIATADFFSVEVLTIGGLVRYLIFFVIDLKTRRAHIVGVTPRADRAWMPQVARNLTDAVTGPLRGFGHLIVDRDPRAEVYAYGKRRGTFSER